MILYGGISLLRISEIRMPLKSLHCLLSQVQREVYKTSSEIRIVFLIRIQDPSGIRNREVPLYDLAISTYNLPRRGV